MELETEQPDPQKNRLVEDGGCPFDGVSAHSTESAGQQLGEQTLPSCKCGCITHLFPEFHFQALVS